MTETGEAPELLLVTGMSGAGKTAATASLDDLGWFVVDNLPPSLLMELVDTVAERTPHRRIAVVADVRGGVFFGDLRGALDELAARGLRPYVLFLEAGDEALVRRFESARRPHPLQGEGRVLDGIKREREQLAELRAGADLVDRHVAAQRARAGRRIADAPSRGRTRVCVPSWCRSGSSTASRSTPTVIADLRFLPNPHWVPELRPQTGLDEAVRDYVLGQPGATEFLDRYAELLRTASDGLPAGGQALRDRRRRLHRWQAP